MSEAGLTGFDAVSWYRPMFPAGTPADAVNRLLNQSLKLLRQPEIRKRLLAGGIDAAGSTQEEFAGNVHSEVEKWARVIRATGAKPD